MQKVTVIKGVAAPLLRDDINSDQILPGAYLRGFKPDYAAGLFAFWRQDPHFILNQAGYDQTRILIVGQNFGCGSTREQAVWAIERFGIRVLIGLGFAEIFRENLLKNAILPIILKQDTYAAIVKAAASIGSRDHMTVDLASQTISVPGAEPVHFEILESERIALLEGLDEIGLTLLEGSAIATYEQKDRLDHPWQQEFITRLFENPISSMRS
jgi:3-isopropylmalate/(R)-2-methylmalate dehydratase small subunit